MAAHAATRTARRGEAAAARHRADSGVPAVARRTLQRRTRRLAEWTKAADGEKKGREMERRAATPARRRQRTATRRAVGRAPAAAARRLEAAATHGRDAWRRRAAAVVAASAGSGAVTAVARLRRMFDNAMDSNGFEGYGEATIVGCRVRISRRVRDVSKAFEISLHVTLFPRVSVYGRRDGVTIFRSLVDDDPIVATVLVIP
ncbi:hypothetical protein Scep_012538 [Stephania cephalantha]|uniref:Uncharacterized protein n=1 Tax=Stephania cephalantha TaxID=152367 RepID=A0AAP0JG50_9MAGN